MQMRQRIHARMIAELDHLQNSGFVSIEWLEAQRARIEGVRKA